jgi:hypothetical protein
MITYDVIQYKTWITALQRTKQKLLHKDKFDSFKPNKAKSSKNIHSNNSIEKKIGGIENNNSNEPKNSPIIKDSPNFKKPSIENFKSYTKSSNRLLSVLIEDI